MVLECLYPPLPTFWAKIPQLYGIYAAQICEAFFELVL